MPDSMIWEILEKHNIGSTENSDCVFAVEEIVQIIRELRNELCLKCEKYKDAHNGACDWCKWK